MIAQLEAAFAGAREEFGRILEYAQEAVRRGAPMHEVEQNVWGFQLNLTRLVLQGYVDGQGTGDVGETLELPDGRVVKRLEGLYSRPYKSIVGEVTVTRCVYGTREKQKFEAIPLDARLELPAEDSSYLLQDWDQWSCVEEPFGKTSESLERILGLSQPVGTLEHMNRSLAAETEVFREAEVSEPLGAGGEVLAVSADCKGIPMRREPGEVGPEDPDHLKKGEKRTKKRMACVGACYTVDPFPRTVDEVMDEVLRKKAQQRRPQPQDKHLRAELTRSIDGEEVNGKDRVFAWLRDEVNRRDPDDKKTVVFLADGEKKLEEKAQEYLQGIDFVSVLDLMHASPRLWQAAYCFHAEGSAEAKEFVTERLRRLLEGEVGYVIGGLRQMATKRKKELTKKQQKTLTNVTQYYENNRERMKYDEYLAAGYPIGTGPVEGACRNLIKDRFEQTGMRWTVPGAQAMLDLRAIRLNGDWEDFCRSRIEHETERLYPYRHAIQEAPCWNHPTPSPQPDVAPTLSTPACYN